MQRNYFTETIGYITPTSVGIRVVIILGVIIGNIWDFLLIKRGSYMYITFEKGNVGVLCLSYNALVHKN